MPAADAIPHLSGTFPRISFTARIRAIIIVFAAGTIVIVAATIVTDPITMTIGVSRSWEARSRS
jgi:hypothetical protein